MNFETVETQLKAAIGTGLAYAAQVETYAGQIEDIIESRPVAYPAVFVAYGGSRFDPVDGPNYREEVTFSIVVCAQSLKGESDARTRTNGAYDMVQDVKAAVVNKNLGLAIERFRPGQVAPLLITRTDAIYQLDVVTAWDVTYQMTG